MKNIIVLVALVTAVVGMGEVQAGAARTASLSGNVSCSYVPEIKNLHCGFEGDVQGWESLAPEAEGEGVTVVFRNMSVAVDKLGMSGAGVAMARSTACAYDEQATLLVGNPTLVDDEGGWVLEVDVLKLEDSDGFEVGRDQALRGHPACKA